MQKTTFMWMFALSAVVSVQAPAQRHEELSPSSLQGIESVFVRVHFSGVSDERDGLTADQLWSDIALRLQVAGLKVLTDVAWEKIPGKPYLYVSIQGVSLTPQPRRGGGYVYTCSLDLMQQVTLTRKPNEAVFACTWSRGSSVVVPNNERASIREVIGTMVDGFTRDVLSQTKGNGTRISLP